MEVGQAPTKLIPEELHFLESGLQAMTDAPRSSERAQSTGGVGAGGFSSSRPNLPAAISRSAMTVGLSLLASTCGVAPRAIWRARLVAASVSSKRLGRNLMQSSTVMRAMARVSGYLNSAMSFAK